MAETNRQRVDLALEHIREALLPVVERKLDPLSEGQGWTALMRALDQSKGRDKPASDYSPTDLHLLLRAVTNRLGSLGFPFDFSRKESSLLDELAEARNSYAHNDPFSSDDTLRVLDTAERMLTALGEPGRAKAVRHERMTLQRRVYNEQARADARNVVADLEDNELAPWHEVLAPHPDVLNGSFKESEFAANLHSVATESGDTGQEYKDPAEFFRRTYLTEGLKDLLTQAAGRVSGANGAGGAPVINLQTTFGGGKTHSMLAVWHLFSGVEVESLPDEVSDIARSAGIDGLHVNRAAVVGTEIAPGQLGVKADGTKVHTLWGEIAYQLGGSEAYALVAEADRTATNPGAALRTLFARYAPCVILVDEWVAYARQLVGRDDLPGGTFDTQFTFAQALTEAASQTPGALVLVSIPASDAADVDDDLNDLEIGGEKGRQAITRLEHVVGRTAHQWQPAEPAESFEIVRRRLFTEPNAESDRRIRATARKFVKFYRDNSGDLPREAWDEARYEERITRCFPIHPELFDRLYEDWSTLDRFQRTRGVLRLMSTVVNTLVATGDRSPMIMPGTVPVGVSAVESEFMQYLENSWRAVIDSDIEGEEANAQSLDREKPLFGNRSVTTRLARALFLDSAPTVNSTHRGAERKQLFLGVAMPGDTIGNFHSALSQWEDRSSYVFHDGERFWLDVSPSLNRTARVRAKSIEDHDVDTAVVERLRAGQFTGDMGRQFGQVLVDPVDSAAVPDQAEARLVVLGPQCGHVFAKGRNTSDSAAQRTAREIVTKRGASGRQFQNSVVFLAPDAGRVEELRSVVRDYMAWNGILRDESALNLTSEQKSVARKRRDELNTRIDHLVLATWIWCLAPNNPEPGEPGVRITPLKADDGEKNLVTRAAKKLSANGDLIMDVYGFPLIRLELDNTLHAVWNKGEGVSVDQLWEFHAKYTYLARIRSIGALIEGIEGVLSDALGPDMFWLAEGYDRETGDFIGLAEPLDDSAAGFRVDGSTLLVRPEIAKAQRERTNRSVVTPAVPVEAGGATSAAEVEDSGRRDSSATTAQAEGIAEARPTNTRYTASWDSDSIDTLADDLQNLVDEIVENLRTGKAETLDVHVEIAARKSTGFDERTVRNVVENAKNLGLDESIFED